MDRLHDFGFLIRDVSRLSVLNFEREAKSLKLTLRQCKVLISLQHNEGISQARLAELSEVDAMTLVRLLDWMERDGWVERRKDPADRRARRLFMKPAANPIIDEIWHIADRALAAAFMDLSAEQREQLMSLLEHVHANLIALAPGVGETGTPQSSTASKSAAAASPIRPTSKKVSP